ncbi:MAG TPA: DUF4465 domain-containing protein [Flavipsychrobacter sp.]|nr:DUF4465 domain-containing protein [Flavipsychrobacter sp.]
MRKILLFVFPALAATGASAQNVVDFESLTLPKTDTFYVNYSNPGQDVGFNENGVHFQCYYDTAWGGLWSNGFSYSNMTDSISSGYTNQYAAKTAKGYSGSANYAVYWDGYGAKAKIILPAGIPLKTTGTTVYGFYVTNSTYAYNSMRDGDFAAKKFGDTTGTGSGLPQGKYPDWFKLTVQAYANGSLLNDSVDFFLADYRFNDDDSDYIVNDWRWVDLSVFSTSVDSLQFTLTSSDNGQFGMNTPAYFCMDNFGALLSADVPATSKLAAKIYPNPVANELHVEVSDHAVKTVYLTDLTGKRLATYTVSEKHIVIHTAQLSDGMYLIQLDNGKQIATQRFIKQ